MTRTVRSLALVVLTLALLSGCVGLSGSGPVEPGLVLGQGDLQPIQVVPPGPAAGATQEQILRGFLVAGGASGGGYGPAREFLAGDRTGWSPDDAVAVIPSWSSLDIRRVNATTLELRSLLAATISGGGRYTVGPATPRVARVGFVKVRGQWRISVLPKGFGRWIPADDLRRLVQPYAVHFVANDRMALVPDVRWFPLDHLPTRLARAQLEPVPPYLAGVVHSGIPPGTKLSANAVSLSHGTATVDLDSPVPEDPAARRSAWAQLVATLMQDPLVNGVEVRAGGTSIDLQDVESPVSSLTAIGFPLNTPPQSALAVVRRGREVTTFDPELGVPGEGRATPRPDPATFPPIPEGYTAMALSADASELAALGPAGKGLSRWRGRTEYEVPFFATDLGHPAYDRLGSLWVGGIGVGKAADKRLFVVDTTADPTVPAQAAARPVAAPWLARRRVVESRVAADGERIALLTTTPDGKDLRIDVSGVVRDDVGRPSALSDPLRLATGARDLRGLTWVDEVSVATIGTPAAGGAARPLIVGLGGQVTPLEPVPGAVRVAAAKGSERSLVVVTDRGAVLARAGLQWSYRGKGTDIAVAAG